MRDHRTDVISKDDLVQPVVTGVIYTGRAMVFSGEVEQLPRKIPSVRLMHNLAPRSARPP
jgi:hypothetical protein